MTRAASRRPWSKWEFEVAPSARRPHQETDLKLVCKLALIVCALAIAAQAGELAVLRNGYSISHVRREVIQNITRLYISEKSYLDVPTEEIVRFEKEEAPQSPPAPPATSVPELVNRASNRHLLDADLINSVIHAESDFNPKAVSPKGARGLMQLMPETASRLGVRDSFDAGANIEGGTRYLRELLALYNNDLVKALAAYNAGPVSVQRFRGVPPYHETRLYVARVIREFNRKKLAQQPIRKTRRVGPARKQPVSKRAATAVNPGSVTLLPRMPAVRR